MATIRDNDVKFVLHNGYTLIGGSYVVTDGRVTNGQPSEVTRGKILTCNSSGVFRFRVGRKHSESVAKWFNNILNTEKNTTFGHAAGSLNFAFIGNLSLTIKNNKTGSQYSVLFDDVVMAQGHSGSSNNWWFGGKYAYCLGSNKISVVGVYGEKEKKTLICRRGGNGVNVIDVEHVYDPSWMMKLDNGLYISEINIPGTHDSGTGSYTGAAAPWAKTQSVSIKQQLDSGIRYLDIRCRHINNVFTIHHGNVYLGINFDNVLEDCTQFLKENPSECIFMQIKEEHNPKNNNRGFPETFESYVVRTKNFWVLNETGKVKNTIPLLSEVRGRIFLVRRFKTGVKESITRSVDVTHWPDNSKRFEVALNDDGKIVIQDEYKNSISNKISVFGQLANESKNKPKKTWFINYSSTTHGAVSLRDLANGVNKGVMKEVNSGKFSGTVVMDYPENHDGLSDEIISHNPFLKD
ncbi:phosphatidylinositol-specific phospholipase C [Klebsiella sp. BIGb0407]|uniref:phosphatidylinositol-specific phospholipase C n=1 Tax=Klebsiella sp. BIGb0407 TaxID=2940603 RepID=UPI002168BA1D|nr:phosphatidylinositol-specific phospholipase C [Klebsiella sp. BIGb0407]MCS3433889.1 1-phosphatidylinositol phosphodiesterase [Klebsiella sp. BIGb0407]